jgi:hypothetical protein
MQELRRREGCSETRLADKHLSGPEGVSPGSPPPRRRIVIHTPKGVILPAGFTPSIR